MSYATNLGSILNKPSSVIVKDGSGNTAASTSYFYDQQGTTATSNTPQHIPVGTVRGNLTTLFKLENFVDRACYVLLVLRYRSRAGRLRCERRFDKLHLRMVWQFFPLQCHRADRNEHLRNLELHGRGADTSDRRQRQYNLVCLQRSLFLAAVLFDGRGWQCHRLLVYPNLGGECSRVRRLRLGRSDHTRSFRQTAHHAGAAGPGLLDL